MRIASVTPHSCCLVCCLALPGTDQCEWLVGGEQGAVQDTTNPWWEVTSLEDLKVLGFVGRGSCGLVKKVLHIPTQQVLAVKVRHPAQSGELVGQWDEADG